MDYGAVAAIVTVMGAGGAALAKYTHSVVSERMQDLHQKIIEGRSELKEHFREGLDEQFLRINGSYVKKEVHQMAMAEVHRRVEALEKK